MQGPGRHMRACTQRLGHGVRAVRVLALIGPIAGHTRPSPPPKTPIPCMHMPALLPFWHDERVTTRNTSTTACAL